MRSSRFLSVCVLSFILLGGGYFLLIDRLAIVDAPLGKSYRQFLLGATDDMPNRIIVESGSNAVHSIDALALERHFKRPALILSDNAGYPLEHKIRRLANHLNPGDTVILPLEWLHYRADGSAPADYVESILDTSGSNAFYYQELSWPERVRFVYQSVPVKLALERLVGLNALERWNPQLGVVHQESQQRFAQLIQQNARGNELIDAPLPMESLTQGLACDQFLFGLFEFATINPVFADNLRRLNELRDNTGAQIIFAWPTVTARDDDECYQLWRNEIVQYVHDIRQMVEAENFAFIGEPEDSRFPASCMLDTYYHVLAHCAAQRTRTLIEQLDAYGVQAQPELDEQVLQAKLLERLSYYSAGR